MRPLTLRVVLVPAEHILSALLDACSGSKNLGAVICAVISEQPLDHRLHKRIRSAFPKLTSVWDAQPLHDAKTRISLLARLVPMRLNAIVVAGCTADLDADLRQFRRVPHTLKEKSLYPIMIRLRTAPVPQPTFPKSGSPDKLSPNVLIKTTYLIPDTEKTLYKVKLYVPLCVSIAEFEARTMALEEKAGRKGVAEVLRQIADYVVRLFHIPVQPQFTYYSYFVCYFRNHGTLLQQLVRRQNDFACIR